jgi:hypothetical protein
MAEIYSCANKFCIQMLQQLKIFSLMNAVTPRQTTCFPLKINFRYMSMTHFMYEAALHFVVTRVLLY